MSTRNPTLMEYLAESAQVRRIMQPNTKREYSCFEDFVARNGTVYGSEPLTREELAVVKAAAKSYGGFKKFLPKECYHNAQTLVMANPTGELIYNEGYVTGVIPFLHGWVTINNKIVDVTLRHYDLDRESDIFSDADMGVTMQRLVAMPPILGKLPNGRSYVGVPFGRGYVVDKFLENGTSVALIDNWRGNFPLLTSPKVRAAALLKRG